MPMTISLDELEVRTQLKATKLWFYKNEILSCVCFSLLRLLNSFWFVAQLIFDSSLALSRRRDRTTHLGSHKCSHLAWSFALSRKLADPILKFWIELKRGHKITVQCVKRHDDG